MGPVIQYAIEKNDPIEIRIYSGVDGEFTLYEDENDNYNYEKKKCSTITFNWDDSKKTLTIGSRRGSFPGMLDERKFNIVKVSKSNEVGIDKVRRYDKVITYTGKKDIINLF